MNTYQDTPTLLCCSHFETFPSTFQPTLSLHEVKHVTMSCGKTLKLEGNELLNLRQKEPPRDVFCLLQNYKQNN